MKRFTFKLDRVLNYRVALEEEKKRHLADAQRAVVTQEEHIRIIESEIGRQMSELRARSLASVDVGDLVVRRRYVSYLRSALSSAYEALELLKGQLEARREELVAASKDRKVLERVRERRFGEYLYEQDREEQKFIDEIGTFRR